MPLSIIINKDQMDIGSTLNRSRSSEMPHILLPTEETTGFNDLAAVAMEMTPNKTTPTRFPSRRAFLPSPLSRSLIDHAGQIDVPNKVQGSFASTFESPIRLFRRSRRGGLSDQFGLNYMFEFLGKQPNEETPSAGNMSTTMDSRHHSNAASMDFQVGDDSSLLLQTAKFDDVLPQIDEEDLEDVNHSQSYYSTNSKRSSIMGSSKMIKNQAEGRPGLVKQSTRASNPFVDYPTLEKVKDSFLMERPYERKKKERIQPLQVDILPRKRHKSLREKMLTERG